MTPRICILGAGVVGLATANRLLDELPWLNITVVAELIGTETTTAGSGGLWKPYSLGKMPPARVVRYGKATFEHLRAIHDSADAGPAGVALTTSYQLWDRPEQDPDWKDVVPHFRHLTPRELAMFPGHAWTHGWQFTTLICDSRLYLAWLQQRFVQAGGKLQRRRVASLAELADFDLVINCAGLGAGKLADDAAMHPVRGQVIRVHAPWVQQHYDASIDGATAYIIPNTDSVVLGGTLQKGNWDTRVSMQDRQGILDRVCRVLPSLRNARVISDWAGLRPYREPIRVELEHVQVQQAGSQGSKQLPVVHHYGHGGSGITLAWGTAEDAVKLALQAIESMQGSLRKPESKL